MIGLENSLRWGALICVLLVSGCGNAETMVREEAPGNTIDAVEAPVTDDAATLEAIAAMESAFALAEETNGPGTPALWRIADEDTELYLFGTVHILRPETDWRSDHVDAAFNSADRIVLEVDATSLPAQQEMARLLPEYGMFPKGTNLLDHLDPAEEAAISSASERFGIPLSGIARFKPWLISAQLMLLNTQADGFDPNSGIEMVLTEEAKSSGKDFAYLETQADQLIALSGGTLEDQIDSLVLSARTIDRGADMLDRIVAEWADGDLTGLGALLSEPTLIGGEDAYNTLLVNRNRNWVPQIKAMMDDPGVTFIAVGAAHLAGPDSVVEMLRAEGLVVEGL